MAGWCSASWPKLTQAGLGLVNIVDVQLEVDLHGRPRGGQAGAS
jgi:hypothetical protein